MIPRLFPLLLLLAGCSTALPTGAPAQAAADEEAIRAVLAQQVDAWNAGSLRGFMAGYAETDDLRFASGGNVRTGWAETLAAYERGYPDRSAMGALRFDDLDVQVLSPRWALVFGRWQLDGTEEAPWGLFTLLFEQRPEGWRVIHDHTSSGV